jgi:hypothetical protein
MVRSGVPRNLCSLTALKAVAFPAHLDSAVLSRAGFPFLSVRCRLAGRSGGICHDIPFFYAAPGVLPAGIT